MDSIIYSSYKCYLSIYAVLGTITGKIPALIDQTI